MAPGRQKVRMFLGWLIYAAVRCFFACSRIKQMAGGFMMCEEISLCMMTRALCHELYQNWENDPAIYMDMDLFAPYQYNENAVNRYFDSKQDSSRILFAIMRDGRPVGELQLKQIDRERKECTLSIHMQNDTVKGRGYGTCAEKMALKYAFDVLGMAAVNADTVIKNVRSQHVLEKIGFQFTGERDGFKYYRYERAFP